MGKVVEVKLSKNNQMWFVAGDWHSFNLDIPTFNILVEHAFLVAPEHRNLIINGDFIDTPYFMPKNTGFAQWKDRVDGIEMFFLPEFEKEIKWANDTLDALQSVFKNIVFIFGNHDSQRIDNFRENYCPSAYQEHFYLHKQLNLSQRNVGWIEYGDWLDIGNISITHGNFHGPSALKKHFEASGGRNVLFSHVHTAECKSFTSRGHTRCSWSLPAMCDLNPHYIRNNDTAWVNGYGTLFMKPNGNFNFHTHLIIDNELCLPNGQVLKGKK